MDEFLEECNNKKEKTQTAYKNRSINSLRLFIKYAFLYTRGSINIASMCVVT